VSNLLTDWRAAVVTHLDANLQAGAFAGNVRAGERDGPSRIKQACVFVPTMRTDGGNVSFARPVLVVRAWVGLSKVPTAIEPRDPEPLEQLMVDLATCLQQIQNLPAVGLNGLYFFVTELLPDYDDFGVQATLQAWTGNPAVIA